MTPRATTHAIKSETTKWHGVAARLGIDARYTNGLGDKCCAPLETVRAAINAMGAPTHSLDASLRWALDREAQPSPIHIAWDGELRGERIPTGCHQNDGWILSAPARHPQLRAPRVGAFLPLYALHSSRSLGIADLSDLDAFAAVCDERFVATLPLFATFVDPDEDLGARFDPSPYAPISRSFFSELFLDPRETREWQRCPGAQEILKAQRPALDAELGRPYVDYASVARLRRPILERLAERADDGTLGGAEVQNYAAFRADLTSRPDTERFHRYVQARLAEQMERVASRRALYLDLPVGVHRGGYDALHYADDFLPGFSAGAPPDAMFRSGQCWGISALNPIGARRSAYASFRSGVATLSRYAQLLRLDHVMALHRTFCVPDGAEASEGVYIRANADELYAALLATAGSAEHPPVLIGEDLGTVPAFVRESLAKRGVLGMHVAQLDPSLPVTPGTCASINTHDLATFASYAAGDDLEDFAALGLVAKEELEDALRARRRGVLAAGDYETLKTRVLQSEASYVVLSTEDEWGERRPQNTPGTSVERPNFKRRAAKSLSEIAALAERRPHVQMSNP